MRWKYFNNTEAGGISGKCISSRASEVFNITVEGKDIYVGLPNMLESAMLKMNEKFKFELGIIQKF